MRYHLTDEERILRCEAKDIKDCPYQHNTAEGELITPPKPERENYAPRGKNRTVGDTVARSQLKAQRLRADRARQKINFQLPEDIYAYYEERLARFDLSPLLQALLDKHEREVFEAEAMANWERKYGALDDEGQSLEQYLKKPAVEEVEVEELEEVGPRKRGGFWGFMASLLSLAGRRSQWKLEPLPVAPREKWGSYSSGFFDWLFQAVKV